MFHVQVNCPVVRGRARLEHCLENGDLVLEALHQLYGPGDDGLELDAARPRGHGLGEDFLPLELAFLHHVQLAVGDEGLADVQRLVLDGAKNEVGNGGLSCALLGLGPLGLDRGCEEAGGQLIAAVAFALLHGGPLAVSEAADFSLVRQGRHLVLVQDRHVGGRLREARPWAP